MAFQVNDPRSGRAARVDKRNRLQTSSLGESESNYATSLGLKFNVNTGDITLTSAAKTTVLYFKNNDTRDVVIDALIYNLGNSNGTGDVVFEVLRNPTTGGIVTAALPVAVGTGVEANLNYGSTNILNANIYKGATGQAVTTTGLSQIFTRNPTPTGRILISPGGGVLLPKGTSIAINYTPPVGNTTQIVQFALNVYVKELT